MTATGLDGDELALRPAPARHTIFLLAGIAALGSLATQLLVPALPTMARELRSGVADAQLVVGVFLIGLGMGQLFWGSLADRIGRRPVLLAGLSVYALASIAAAFAPGLGVLLAARAVQSLGASAGVLTARVLVSDIWPPAEAAAKQATLMAVVLVSPALAPVIGGALTEWLGWRAMFGLLAGLGVMAALAAMALLPLHRRPAAPGTATAGLLAGYRRLARNRRFASSALAIAAGSTALHMFLGSAPFLLAHDFGLSPRAIGNCLMIVALASIGGTFLVGRIERRGDALLAGTASAMAGSILLLGLSLAGLGGLTAFLGPMLLLGLGAGLTGPAGISHVMRAEKGLEGTAASICGAVQMLASAGGAYALLHFAPVGILPVAVALAACCGIALAAAIWRRHAAASIGEDIVQGLA